jgi:hypothetical protein
VRDDCDTHASSEELMVGSDAVNEIGLDVVGTTYQLKKEENILEEIEDVNYIFSLLMSKLHDPFVLPVGD